MWRENNRNEKEKEKEGKTIEMWWWWIRREKMWWWLYIVSLFTKSCLKNVESRVDVGSMWVDVGSRLNSIPLLDYCCSSSI